VLDSCPLRSAGTEASGAPRRSPRCSPAISWQPSSAPGRPPESWPISSVRDGSLVVSDRSATTTSRRRRTRSSPPATVWQAGEHQVGVVAGGRGPAHPTRKACRLASRFRGLFVGRGRASRCGRTRRRWSSRRASPGCSPAPAGVGPVRPLGVVELERASDDGVQHAVGVAANAPLLQPGLVVGAQPASWATSSRRRSGDATALPVERNPRLVWGDLGAVLYAPLRSIWRSIYCGGKHRSTLSSASQSGGSGRVGAAQPRMGASLSPMRVMEALDGERLAVVGPRSLGGDRIVNLLSSLAMVRRASRLSDRPPRYRRPRKVRRRSSTHWSGISHGMKWPPWSWAVRFTWLYQAARSPWRKFRTR
jgi:hypothetical protein